MKRLFILIVVFTVSIIFVGCNDSIENETNQEIVPIVAERENVETVSPSGEIQDTPSPAIESLAETTEESTPQSIPMSLTEPEKLVESAFNAYRDNDEDFLNSIFSPDLTAVCESWFGSVWF